MKHIRLTHQAIKDLEAFDPGIRDRMKESLHHLADHPPKDKPLKGRFQKDKGGPTECGRIVFSTAPSLAGSKSCRLNTAKTCIGDTLLISFTKRLRNRPANSVARKRATLHKKCFTH